MCRVHKRPLEVVCFNCKVKICTNCALFGEHKGHEIKPVEEVIDDVTEKAE